MLDLNLTLVPISSTVAVLKIVDQTRHTKIAGSSSVTLTTYMSFVSLLKKSTTWPIQSQAPMWKLLKAGIRPWIALITGSSWWGSCLVRMKFLRQSLCNSIMSLFTAQTGGTVRPNYQQYLSYFSIHTIAHLKASKFLLRKNGFLSATCSEGAVGTTLPATQAIDLRCFYSSLTAFSISGTKWVLNLSLTIVFWHFWLKNYNLANMATSSSITSMKGSKLRSKRRVLASGQ